MSREWQIIEMNPAGSREWSFSIPYVWMTPQYGRAEFSVCARWKRGRIAELWISPHQQPTEQGKIYHFNVGHSTGIIISRGPDVWCMNWCEEHKAQNFSMYVERDTKYLHIGLLSNISLACLETK